MTLKDYAVDKEWLLRPTPAGAQEAVDQAASAYRLPALVRTLLAQRGVISEEELEKFLRPKLAHLTAPEALPNMPEAVTRLEQAIDRRERVVLYGDYDVDGVTSLAILCRVLRELGLVVRPFLPHRGDEGYGLSEDGLRRCLTSERPHLLMAVDCGTSSLAEIAWLRAEGIDVIVLDHHEPALEGLPDAIVVNPKLGNDFHYLCTAGLAFKLAHALLKARGTTAQRSVLENLLDLVALGTVADVVPLVAENRLLVSKGLEKLETTRHAGLRALKDVCGVQGRPRAMHLGFRLGPRLNAAGRLDTAQAALDLLTTENGAQASALAHQLDEQNRERQAVQARVESEAMAAAAEKLAASDACALVLGSDSWHPGVVGIVAGKLARRFQRPVFVIAFDATGTGKGSGRSVEGISLVAALDACRSSLVKGGGHPMAAGLTITKTSFEEFSNRFTQAVATQLANNGATRPHLWVDAITPLCELDFELLDAYEKLEPFGEANREPLLLLRGVEPYEEPRLLKEKHRRMSFHQQGTIATAMWFDSASIPLPPPPWDAVVTIQRGAWRGEERVEIYIQNLRSAHP
jgi:single-stranded-DNA-specific exonuclease